MKCPDCRMEQGSLRCDANISIRPVGQKEYNTKVEIKNINSFRELQKALEKEEKRQSELYQFGEGFKIKQETRRWDSGKGRTISMRFKEEAHDYRYFTEPDLMPIIIQDATIDEIRATLPEMPLNKASRFISSYMLTESEVEILIEDQPLAEFYESVIKAGASPKVAANWVLGDLLRALNEKEMSSGNIPVKPAYLSRLITLIESGRISNTAGKEVFKEMFISDKTPEELVELKGLGQISSEDDLIRLIQEVITANPQSAADFKSGKPQSSRFLNGAGYEGFKGQSQPESGKGITRL